MSDINLQLGTNSDEVNKLIQQLSEKLTPATFKAVIDQAAALIAISAESFAVIYPAARPESDYHRTGRLGASITSEIRREGEYTSAVVGTNVDYAIWVVGPKDPPEGEKGQAWMHEDIWTPMDESIKAHNADFEEILLSELRAAVKLFSH